MKIEIPDRVAQDINKDTIKQVLYCLGIINVEYEFLKIKRNGRNIIIQNEEKRIYVIFSREQADARNAFLNQFVSTVLSLYMNDKDNFSKEIYVYLLDTSSKASTPYMIDTYRMLKTLGISILNEVDLRIDRIKPYTNVHEWKNARTQRQDFNRSNNSTYVLENSDTYYIYGKSFGANAKESSLICCMIAKIAAFEGKSVHLYQVEENDTKRLPFEDKLLIESYGVIVEKSILSKFGPRQYQNQSQKNTSRDQATFQYNLLKKYGDKKCIICNSKIEESIIASHIHRISDIDKSNVTWLEKCKEAVDPDNGIWLCANHDKMFEYGLFYFVDQKLIISNQLIPLLVALESNLKTTVDQIENSLLKKQINEFLRRNNDLLVLRSFEIDTIYYGPNMHRYLELHRKRVGAC